MALLGRDTLITGPLPDGVLLLETFQGKETLGAPYRYDLTLLSEDHDIPVGKVLGQSLTVHVKLDSGDTRFFNGIVTYFAKKGLIQRRPCRWYNRQTFDLNGTLSKEVMR